MTAISLSFNPTATTELVLDTLVVYPKGSLLAGTQSAPVTGSAMIQFVDTPLNTTFDPGQYLKGLLALGTVHMYGEPKSSTFVRLAAEPQTGATTLTLASPVTGWNVGDKLALPDTRQLDWNQFGNNYVSERELPTISAISSNGLTITLSAPLAYDHPGV